MNRRPEQANFGCIVGFSCGGSKADATIFEISLGRRGTAMRTSKILAILVFLLSLRPTAADQKADQNAKCQGKADQCKAPVKVVGSNRDRSCVCFACEYGKPNQHVVCANNETEIKKLGDKARAVPVSK